MKKAILIAMALVLSLTAEIANADFIFGEPTNLGKRINTPADEVLGCISKDGLSLFFSDWIGSNYPVRPGGHGQEDIWVATRLTTDDEWGEPENLGPPINTESRDLAPDISVDGLVLHFCSDRSGNWDLYVVTRSTMDDDWGEPKSLETVNTIYGETCPRMTPDGLSLYFSGFDSFRPDGYGGADLWVSTRTTTDDEWSEPMNLGPIVNSSSHDFVPSISSDELSLFFGSGRSGGVGGWDIWVTTRTTTDDEWGEPKNLGQPVNTSFTDDTPAISFDGSTLYFKSRRPDGGDLDLWQAPILPVVDLNVDGIVDAADMCIIVEHWGTDEPSCDIGPMPWGDGVVDVHDLVVIAEHLFEDVSLLAHWKLDETEGNIAYDSAGDCNGTLAGNPVWQPSGGIMGGSLLFDGIDDYVSTEFVLNPADGPFSVFAWIKGSAPGQAIISQTDDFNWLCVDASEGNLMTELRYVSRGGSGVPLVSQTPIIDDVWYRVGLSWDGTNRILYVDDVEVAKDTQPSLVSLGSGLYIGARKNREPGTYFSGLIDDIRIYNRAVNP